MDARPWLCVALAACSRTRCDEPLTDLCTDCPTFEEARAEALSEAYEGYGVQVYACVLPFKVVTRMRPDDVVTIAYFTDAGEMIGSVTWADESRACGALAFAEELHYGANPECTPACRFDLRCGPFDCPRDLELLPQCGDTGG